MNICNAPLSYSFTQSNWQLWSGYLCGLLGIWGWGVGFEHGMRKKLHSFEICQAFVEGTVIVSLIMLIFSLLGVWQVAWPITIAGLGVGAVALRKERKLQGKKFFGGLGYRKQGFKWEWVVLWLLALTCGFHLISSPLFIGDITAIWGIHAKELSCSSLFHTHFFNEKVWAGTHPEYPLFSHLCILCFSLFQIHSGMIGSRSGSLSR